mgnify:FL=1
MEFPDAQKHCVQTDYCVFSGDFSTIAAYKLITAAVRLSLSVVFYQAGPP